jgi:photosystem II stability/assembly factor-like uncharacterized protein
MKKLFVVLVMLVAMNANGQWVKLGSGSGIDTGIFSLIANGSTIFAGTYYNGVYKSTNAGTSWTYSGVDQEFVNAMTISGNNTYAGTDDANVFLSTDYGLTWTKPNLEQIGLRVLSIYSFGSNIFKGASYGVYMSSNNGTNWVYRANGIPQNGWIVTSFASIGSNLFACAYGSVYVTTNNGINWTDISNGITNGFSRVLKSAGSELYFGLWDGFYYSSNNGANWESRNHGIEFKDIRGLAISGSNIFAGTGDSGVYLSTNKGLIWSKVNQGLGELTVYDVMIYNNYLFAGTYSSVWRRPISEMIGISNISTEIPSSYSLNQNYPNPFNPTTNIKFSIIKAEQVKLIVYDIQGREVLTLVNESLQPGTYETEFDGSMLNSGVYFYKITSGNFSETKKMLLLK